jgi:hypothetical protein
MFAVNMTGTGMFPRYGGAFDNIEGARSCPHRTSSSSTSATPPRRRASTATSSNMKPVFETPGFIAFDLASGVQLALWSRAEADLAATTIRTSELCLAVEGAPASVDALYESWKAKDIRVVAEPADEGFGRTFVIADSDSNLIRVAPVD